MLARTALRRAAALRTYATAAAPDASPPPIPATKAPMYDPDREPALAQIGYPELSRDSRQLRSPKGWWDNQERIQFGEPVRPSSSPPPPPPSPSPSSPSSLSLL